MGRQSSAVNAAFSRRLRELRTSAHLSQETLASRSSLSRTSITNIEKGRQHVSLDVLYRLADAMGVEPRALLPGRAELAMYDDIDLEGVNALTETDQIYVRAVMKKQDLTGG
jgi:transcriptional regulator with XRE-family HTH domain